MATPLHIHVLTQPFDSMEFDLTRYTFNPPHTKCVDSSGRVAGLMSEVLSIREISFSRESEKGRMEREAEELLEEGIVSGGEPEEEGFGMEGIIENGGNGMDSVDDVDSDGRTRASKPTPVYREVPAPRGRLWFEIVSALHFGRDLVQLDAGGGSGSGIGSGSREKEKDLSMRLFKRVKRRAAEIHNVINSGINGTHARIRILKRRNGAGFVERNLLCACWKVDRDFGESRNPGTSGIVSGTTTAVDAAQEHGVNDEKEITTMYSDGIVTFYRVPGQRETDAMYLDKFIDRHRKDSNFFALDSYSATVCFPSTSGDAYLDVKIWGKLSERVLMNVKAQDGSFELIFDLFLPLYIPRKTSSRRVRKREGVLKIHSRGIPFLREFEHLPELIFALVLAYEDEDLGLFARFE